MRSTVALFVGAIVLLLASAALIVAMLRQGPTQANGGPPPGGTTIIAAAPTVPPTAPPATSTPSPVATAPATATTRPATATATIRPATATARVTPRPPTATMGGCAIVLPPGFVEEKPGYYPASNQTGFVALDPFDMNGGQRSPAELTQTFVEGTLKVALQDFRQTASIRTDDGSRVEYTAQAGGKAGRGGVVVRRVGEIACAVTLFTLSDSPLPFEQTLDAILATLQPARP